jgi:hypothetical protein
MSTILGILKGILDAIPILDRLIRSFQKTPQEKVDKGVEDLRDEVDEFKKTGRPPR